MDPSKIGREWQACPSDDVWRDVTRLAWRPAWGIRNRQGSVSLLLAWIRRKVKPAHAGKSEKRT